MPKKPDIPFDIERITQVNIYQGKVAHKPPSGGKNVEIIDIVGGIEVIY